MDTSIERLWYVLRTPGGALITCPASDDTAFMAYLTLVFQGTQIQCERYMREKGKPCSR